MICSHVLVCKTSEMKECALTFSHECTSVGDAAALCQPRGFILMNVRIKRNVSDTSFLGKIAIYWRSELY